MKLAIDFGTTNSAVAAITDDGTATLLPLFEGERVQRSVLYASPEGDVFYGNQAFAAYLDNDLQGRFLRSLKAFLSHTVPPTRFGKRRYRFAEIIALYLKFLIRRAEEVTGAEATELVIGRPVRFHGDPARHDHALAQLQQAIALAKLPPARLQLEPIAAARRYEAGLTDDKVLLVGDFGGGTSDFAVLCVGPGRDRHDPGSGVLSVSGVAQAGDAMDSRFMDTFLLDAFGHDDPWTDPESGEVGPWRPIVHNHVTELFYIPLLRTPDLEDQLDRMEPRMHDPTGLHRLRRLVFDDLGFPLAWAIETSKKALSAADTTTFAFREFYNPRLDFTRDVDLPRFALAATPQLDAYRDAIARAVADAGLTLDDIDEVFLTGGTSQLPFVRGLFRDLLGEGKLREADALTSVCEGLALS